MGEVPKSQLKLDQVAVMDVTESTSLLLFHPFEPTIVIADDKDGISVWDRDTAQRISSFKNSSQDYFTSRTTSISLVNENDTALLLVGSDDGIVRVWANYDEPSQTAQGNELRLVSAWRALPSLVPGGRGSGLVHKWQQMTGHLFVSGDAGFIRIWDLESETAIQDVNTGSDTCVTTLCSSADNQNHIIAGCGDGTVRIFDSRVAGRFGSLLTFYDHKDWVINLNSPRLSDGKKIISGSIQGDVKFIDISAPTSAYKSIQALPANFMSAFAVHDYMPVLACGSSNQKIKVNIILWMATCR